MNNVNVYDADGWLEAIANCVLRLQKTEFKIREVYAFESELAQRHPQNQHIRAKIRQQLQRLRDQKKLEFLGNGTYRVI